MCQLLIRLEIRRGRHSGKFMKVTNEMALVVVAYLVQDPPPLYSSLTCHQLTNMSVPSDTAVKLGTNAYLLEEVSFKLSATHIDLIQYTLYLHIPHFVQK